ARIQKRTISGKTYYYLVHTIREGKKVSKKEKYLGARLPKDIEGLKSEFLAQICKEKWHPIFERIKSAYSGENRQMPKEVRRKNLEAFSIRFTYDTQRIEGSALSLRETADLLQKGISPGKKPIRDAKEAQAHQKLLFKILKQKKDLAPQIVLDWHKELFWQTQPELAGKLRAYKVMISGSRFSPPSPNRVGPMLMEFFSWYEKNKEKIHPVELAALAHLKFVTIHPFGDGNGRISRLLMNFVLFRNGFPMINIHYEKRRSYYTALEHAQIRGEDSIFVHWLFRRYAKKFKEYAAKGEE
ncbi:MAG: Fic family protein, partial [Candidatus Micrarchaeota archaeon]